MATTEELPTTDWTEQPELTTEAIREVYEDCLKYDDELRTPDWFSSEDYPKPNESYTIELQSPTERLDRLREMDWYARRRVSIPVIPSDSTLIWGGTGR